MCGIVGYIGDKEAYEYAQKLIPATQEFFMAEKKKAKKKGSVPTNKALYARVKAEAKRKFDVYPSAYANAWLVKTYKKRGGGYRSA